MMTLSDGQQFETQQPYCHYCPGEHDGEISRNMYTLLSEGHPQKIQA